MYYKPHKATSSLTTQSSITHYIYKKERKIYLVLCEFILKTGGKGWWPLSCESNQSTLP